MKFYPLDTRLKLNVLKTFRRRPGHLLNVLRTFNLHPIQNEMFWILDVAEDSHNNIQSNAPYR